MKTTINGIEEQDRCVMCNDTICNKCGGHESYGIDCLNATMNPDVDYCECE